MSRTSVLKVFDDAPAADLKQFGIDNVHDRPLILQHTLQDFIFMKPKARYEVLSAMLGLEPLIALRSAIEAAKTEFSRKLPPRAQQAQSRRTLLTMDFQKEPYSRRSSRSSTRDPFLPEGFISTRSRRG